MDHEEILMEIHGNTKTLMERTENHGKQLETVFGLMNSGGCSTGRANAVAIKWMWGIGSIVTGAIFFVIGYFHIGD